MCVSAFLEIWNLWKMMKKIDMETAHSLKAVGGFFVSMDFKVHF